MEPLKDRCSDYLSTKLTVDNFSKLLLLAHRLQANGLLDSCLKYFEDHGKEVVVSEDWHKIMSASPELLAILVKILTLKS